MSLTADEYESAWGDGHPSPRHGGGFFTPLSRVAFCSHSKQHFLPRDAPQELVSAFGVARSYVLVERAPAGSESK